MARFRKVTARLISRIALTIRPSSDQAVVNAQAEHIRR
jgi:hypothetical protein